MSERVGIVALVLALGLAAAPAIAAPSEADKAEARRHFEAGVAKAKVQHYDEAIKEFMRAYELSPSPTPLYNIAVARAENGQHVQAIEMFQRYLAEGGDMVPADRRAKVQTRMAELEAKLGTIKVRVSPETAELLLDGRAIDVAAAAQGIRVEPGPHIVIATGEGLVTRKEVPEVGQGAVVEVALALVAVPPSPEKAPAPSPPAAPPPAFVARAAVVPPPPAVQQNVAPPPRDRTSRVIARPLAYALASTGAAALSAGGILYLLAKSDRQKAIDAGCNATSCMGQGATYWKDAQDAVTYSRIAAITGGVLVAAGVTLVIIAPTARDAPIGVAIGGRF